MRKNLFLSMLAVCVMWSMFVVRTQAADQPDAARKEAAMEMLLAMKMDTVMDESVRTALDQQIAANPQIAKHKQIMSDFMMKYISWAALKNDLALIYAEEFTVEELKEMTAFYKTPTGQKVSQKLPLLMAKGMQLGQSRVQENLAELQKAIMDAETK